MPRRTPRGRRERDRSGADRPAVQARAVDPEHPLRQHRRAPCEGRRLRLPRGATRAAPDRAGSPPDRAAAKRGPLRAARAPSGGDAGSDDSRPAPAAARATPLHLGYARRWSVPGSPAPGRRSLTRAEDGCVGRRPAVNEGAGRERSRIMKSRGFFGIVAAFVVLAAAQGASPAISSKTFVDPTGDAQTGAPDITSVVVANSGSQISFRVNV